MTTPLDSIRMVQRGEAAPPPITDLIGFTLTEVEPGRAVVAFDASSTCGANKRWGASPDYA